MKIKMLPVHNKMGMLREARLEQERNILIPFFNRDGIYLIKTLEHKICWFEADDEAYWYDPVNFKYDLISYEHKEKPLRECQYNALKTLEKEKMLSEKQKDILFWFELEKFAKQSSWKSRYNSKKMIREHIGKLIPNRKTQEV